MELHFHLYAIVSPSIVDNGHVDYTIQKMVYSHRIFPSRPHPKESNRLFLRCKLLRCFLFLEFKS